GAYFHNHRTIQSDDSAIHRAQDLLNTLRIKGSDLRSARFENPETLVRNGRKIPCIVVSYGTDDYTRQRPAVPGVHEWTFALWIDPITLTFVKSESHNRQQSNYGNQAAPYGPIHEFITTTT